LVFVDPPYDFAEYPALLESACQELASGGELVVEHRSGAELPEGVPGASRVDGRRYGACEISIYRLAAHTLGDPA